MALRFITVILGAKCPSGKIATLVLILLGLALCRPAHAQCANAGGLYTVTPSQGQAVCIWPTGTGPYGDFPLMPALEIVESDDNDSDCFDYSLTVSFNQANVSNSTYPQSTYGYYESGDLGANDPWIVDWSNNLEPVSGPNTMYEGGIAQVNYEINGDDNGDQGPAFWIAGNEPFPRLERGRGGDGKVFWCSVVVRSRAYTGVIQPTVPIRLRRGRRIKRRFLWGTCLRPARRIWDRSGRRLSGGEHSVGRRLLGLDVKLIRRHQYRERCSIAWRKPICRRK